MTAKKLPVELNIIPLIPGPSPGKDIDLTLLNNGHFNAVRRTRGGGSGSMGANSSVGGGETFRFTPLTVLGGDGALGRASVIRGANGVAIGEA